MYLLSPDKPLDAVPLRIQCFRMQLMQFNFSISYVPGVTLKTVDVLSRFPLAATDDNTVGVEGYAASVIDATAIKNTFMEQIKTAKSADSSMKVIDQF